MTLPVETWTPEVNAILAFSDWTVTITPVVEPNGEEFDVEYGFFEDTYTTKYPVDSFDLNSLTNTLTITHKFPDNQVGLHNNARMFFTDKALGIRH